MMQAKGDQRALDDTVYPCTRITGIDDQIPKQRDAEIAELRAYKREADYSEKLIAAGVDPVSAKAMAKAMPDGVDDSYFEATKQFIAVQKQTILNEKLAKQPGLSVGTPPSAADAQKDEDAKIRQWFGL